MKMILKKTIAQDKCVFYFEDCESILMHDVKFYVDNFTFTFSEQDILNPKFGKKAIEFIRLGYEQTTRNKSQYGIKSRRVSIKLSSPEDKQINTIDLSHYLVSKCDYDYEHDSWFIKMRPEDEKFLTHSNYYKNAE